MKHFFTNTTVCKISLGLLLTFAQAGFAGKDSERISCPVPRNTLQLIQCVLDRSPESLRATLSIEQKQANESAASQMPNPTLSVQSGFLSPSGGNQMDHQIGLTQPLDYSGRRSSLRREAEAQTMQAEAQKAGVDVEIIVGALAKLTRLRQMTVEQRLLKEASETLVKLITLFQNRPSLTPDQQVSLSVFQMAQYDLDLRKLNLNEERKTHENYFAMTTGLNLSDLNAALPKAFTSWPQLSPQAPQLQSPRLAKAKADRALSMGELSTAQADAWPQLAVGPYAQFQRDGANRSTLFGAALNIQLPVLSTNGGARAAAHKAIAIAEKDIEFVQREDSSEIERLSHIYQTSVDGLSKLPSIEEHEGKHAKLEKLFVGGLVTSSLVIEAHRQLLDLVASRHTREGKALEAWWRLKGLTGAISEAIQ